MEKRFTPFKMSQNIRLTFAKKRITTPSESARSTIMASRRKKSQIAPYGIRGMHIEKFRAMHDIDINLGQRITIIAGQNGTGKSTLLGMLGQPFGLRNAKTLFDKTYSTKFTDIFNMSPAHDKPGDHVYFIDFNDTSIPGAQGDHLQVKSYSRPEKDKSHIRIVTGKTRGKGEGNIDYPVIYLGLKRTYPVGEFQNPKAEEPNLSEQELEEFHEWYSRVIVTSGSEFKPVRMSKRGTKETLLVNTESYDYLANSAGQDNLGQILGAFISFFRIKDMLGEDYKGGLLLIDEFDATLFPSSQNSLFDLVYDLAPELQLQVIFTTHSITLIEHALGMANNDDQIRVEYLQKRDSGIQVSENPSIDEIQADLLIEPLPPVKGFKVELWCEDDEAGWLLRQMLTSTLKQKCQVVAANLSCTELGELSIRDKIPSLTYVLFIVDGDSNKQANSKIKNCNKRFVLPGGDMSPEDSIFEMLEALTDDNPFWNNSRRYTKQVFLKRYHEGERAFNLKGGKKKRRYNKEWLKKEKAEGFWGPNGSNVYKLWADRYQSDIANFCKQLEKRVDGMIKRHEHEESQN